MYCEKIKSDGFIVGFLAAALFACIGGCWLHIIYDVGAELKSLQNKERQEYSTSHRLNIECAKKFAEDFLEKPNQNRVSILDFDTVKDVTSITITVNKQKFMIVKLGNEVCNVFRIDSDGFAEEQ